MKRSIYVAIVLFFYSPSGIYAVDFNSLLDASGVWTSNGWGSAGCSKGAEGLCTSTCPLWIKTTVTGPLQVKFKTSYGPLNFYVDGVLKSSTYGLAFPLSGCNYIDHWPETTVSIEIGTHELKWETGSAGGSTADLASVQYLSIPYDTPVLSWTGETNYSSSGVSPEIGTNSVAFNYRVKYTDPDGTAPASGYPKVHILQGGSEISGSPFAMSYVSGENSTGTIYSFSKALTNGTNYSYYFEASAAFGGVAPNFPAVAKIGPGVYKAAISWTGDSGYTAGGLAPVTGDRNTSYIYKIKFSDADNAAPAAGFPKLHIKQGGTEVAGSPFGMNYVSGAYNSGAIYSYTKTLTPSTNYTYYFEANDATSASAGGSPTAEIHEPYVSNQLPSLVWTGEINYLNEGVYPKSASSTSLSVFRVKYIDADNDAPAAGYPKLYVKKGASQVADIPVSMNCSGTGYLAGVICDYSTVLGPGDYSYHFEARDIFNGLASGAPTAETGGLVSIGTDLPAAQEVKVYHGVFKPGENEKSHISFNTSAAAQITIKVYNTVGQMIRELFRGTSNPGLNTVSWDGRDSGGARVSSGVYVIRVEGGGINQSKRVIVVR